MPTSDENRLPSEPAENATPRAPDSMEPTIDVQRAAANAPSTGARGELEEETLPPQDATNVGAARKQVSAAISTKVRYFGDYELVEEIARGGMGVVYKARQISLNRTVALKMILAGQLASQADVRRFHTEAEAAAKLDHPGVVPIHEVGEHEGQHYFSMGFVDGQSLSDLLVDGPLPPREAAELVKKLTEAMAYAHDHGVIHRDLKPANILLDQTDQPRITDFGLAKKLEADSNLTGTGQILGTPSYMPPEQAAGKTDHIGPTADVYSLGAVLYALLTGRPPFQAANPMDTLLQVLDKEPVAPRQLNAGIPRDLETICLKCLAKERPRRYPSANELASELQRFLEGELIQARPAGRLERAWRWCQRKPVVAALGGVIITLLLLIGASGLAVAIIQTRLTGQLREQLLKATAMRLAAQSQSARDDTPVRSLLLAVEAVESARRQDGAMMPLAHETLLNSVADVGGRPVNMRGLRTGSGAISGDGRWIFSLPRIGKWWDGARTTPRLPHPTARLWDLTAADPLAAPRLFTVPRELRRNYNVLDVSWVKISPNGRWMITTGHWGQHLRLWDLAAPDPFAASQALPGHESSISFSAISPNNRWLITGDQEATFQLWDLTAAEPAVAPRLLQRGSLPARDSNESLQAHKCCLSRDGRWLVAPSGDKTARIWDLTAADPTAAPRELAGHERRISWVAIAADGRWLITGSDRGARLWDLTADPTTEPRVLRWNDLVSKSLAFSPDGRWLVMEVSKRQDLANERTNEAQLWDLTADDPAASPRVLEAAFDKHANTVAISADGRSLATASGNTGHYWDLTASDPAASPIVLQGHKNRVTSVAIGADGRWLATGSQDKTARLWNLATPDPSAAFVLRGHDDEIQHVAISSDSRWLLTRGGKDSRLWDLTAANSASSLVLPGHLDVISADGRWLVTTRGDRTTRIWDLSAPEPATVPRLLRGEESAMRSLAISPNGRWLVTACKDAVQLLDLTAADPLESARALPHHRRLANQLDRAFIGGNRSVAISPDSRWLATGSMLYSDDRAARLWDLAAADPTAAPRVLPGESSIWGVTFSPDGRWLFTTERRTVELWDLAMDDPAVVQLVRGHPYQIKSMVISPDGRWLATPARGGSSRNLLCDLKAADPTWAELDNDVHAVAIGPASRWLAAACTDGSIWVWDLASPNPAAGFCRILPGPEDPLYCVAISPDARWLAAGGADNTTRLWDLAAATDPDAVGSVGSKAHHPRKTDPYTSADIPVAPRVLRGHTRAVKFVAFSPDGRWLVTASEDNTVRLWDLDLDSLLHRARALAGREFSNDERQTYLLDE